MALVVFPLTRKVRGRFWTKITLKCLDTTNSALPVITSQRALLAIKLGGGYAWAILQKRD